MSKPKKPCKPSDLLSSSEAAHLCNVTSQRFYTLCKEFNVAPWYDHKMFKLYTRVDIQKIIDRPDRRRKK